MKIQLLRAPLCLLLFCLVTLTACFPTFDWRDVRGADAPYTILMPAKPTQFSREITLADNALTMQMSACDVSGISFAVGAIKLPDPNKGPVILAAMKKGMVSNILKSAGQDAKGAPEAVESAGQERVEVEASPPNGDKIKLVGRFILRGDWAYQVVMLGSSKKMTETVIDTYLTSFKVP
ncbi:MAG: hypothetical protein K2Y28_08130 [Burkholderiaceae bacterium]|nr:hypothetical protein [Burkholderiaceae bacterium]